MQLGVQFCTKIASFPMNGKSQEKLFVIDSNLRRRHLNNFQKIELALSSKPILEEIARRNSKASLKHNKNNNNNSPTDKHLSLDTGTGTGIDVSRVNREIGRRAGVSYETVRKVEKIKLKASVELLNKLRSDNESIHSAYNDIIREEKRQELISQANSSAIATADQKRYQLVNSDFNKVGSKKIADNSVNLIFTDPPYEGKYLSIYDDLAKLAY